MAFRAAKVDRASLVGWASGFLFIGVVTALTLAVRAHDLAPTPFASSAAKVTSGEIWRLTSSALVVDKPVVVGLVLFGLLGLAALRVCGAGVFWIAAVAGHLGSTLTVYAIIGMSRSTDPDVFASAMARQDFGVSAMQGAWVGAIAATAWSWASSDRLARGFVALGVCALAAIGWWLHPDPSILTSEHLFAFLIGSRVVSWRRFAARARAVLAGLVLPPRNAPHQTNG